MAYATQTNTVASIGQRIAEFRATIMDRMSRSRVYRTTMAELNNLSDRELADLGIARATIRSIAFEAAYGET